MTRETGGDILKSVSYHKSWKILKIYKLSNFQHIISGTFDFNTRNRF